MLVSDFAKIELLSNTTIVMKGYALLFLEVLVKSFLVYFEVTVWHFISILFSKL